MYLHIGGEIDLREEEVLFICDMDNATWSHITRASLKIAEEEGRLFNAAEDLPRSFVVCADGTVYLSQLNSATLLRRAENGSFE
ncbi:MAG: DUF370 domain-containing protein [Oscillospiraceae bacterium]|nr:DUF370 domain-containing protein [Oscillospiraceae bacterium]